MLQYHLHMSYYNIKNQNIITLGKKIIQLDSFKQKINWGDGNKDNEIIKEEGHTGKYPTTYKEWTVRKDNSGITRDDIQIDYFIKTYTNENDTILDMTCHNNYVGNRCEHLNRHYIGVDLDFWLE